MNGYSSTRRDLLTTAAMGAATGVAARWTALAGAEPSSLPKEKDQKGRTMTKGGLSTARLGRMHDTMAGYVDRGDIPGLVTLVGRRGDAHVDAIGTNAVGGHDPIQRDTIFRIASMTKPITAVATMILVEECKLRLDEPVDRLLPELANRKVLKKLEGPLDDVVPANRPVTVRDLLTFRMGFGIILAPPGTYPIQKAIDDLRLGQGVPEPQTPPAPDEWMRRLGTLPLMHQPGESWMYNTGCDVLGVLIARASGKPFEEFLQERIFDPLGMNDTAFSVPPAKLKRLASSYRFDRVANKLELYDGPDGQWSRPPAFPGGGVGLVSTVDDFAAFGQMMLNKGRLGPTRILARPTVEVMTTDHLTPEQRAAAAPIIGPNSGWGLGMSVVIKSDAIAAPPGRYGWSGGLGTTWWSDPNEDLVAIIMTQRMFDSPNPPNVCLDFWTSAYQAIDD